MFVERTLALDYLSAFETPYCFNAAALLICMLRLTF